MRKEGGAEREGEPDRVHGEPGAQGALNEAIKFISETEAKTLSTEHQKSKASSDSFEREVQ